MRPRLLASGIVEAASAFVSTAIESRLSRVR